MPLEDFLGAAIEFNAPMVSICCGEPLIYPRIEALVGGLLNQRRIVYICTNGMWMRRKMRDYLAVRYAKEPDTVSAQLNRLASEKLLTPVG
jgi:molybdenum cofactor biosynthesis enzyme MoaA